MKNAIGHELCPELMQSLGIQLKTEETKKDTRAEVHIPRGAANDEPNLLIAVNGVNYVLPRGKTSKVPKHVAAEYYRSRKAQQMLDEQVDKLLAEASK